MVFKWEEAYFGKLLIMSHPDCKASDKIGGFDMDGTLITTKSGKVFAIDQNDWRLLFENETASVLQHLHFDEGYKIVIFTNQVRQPFKFNHSVKKAGISSGKVKVEEFKAKVEAICKALKVPVQVFCSTASDGIFRKPRTGVWEYLCKHKNENVEVDMSKSFFCGDAAGRKKSNGKKDFSCSDRLFAINLELKFYTPEERFLRRKSSDEIIWPAFDPKSVKNENIVEPEGASLFSMDQEVVLMVGIQGSGKSFVANHYLARANYDVVSNDKNGGRDKSISLLRVALKEGRSVVVDNTHVDVDARKKFVDVAKEFKVPVRCFIMTTTFEHAQHNNLFREIVDQKGHAKIGAPIFHSYKSKYQEPTLAEGFSEIVRVNFVPVFEYEEHKILYFMYLLEK